MYLELVIVYTKFILFLKKQYSCTTGNRSYYYQNVYVNYIYIYTQNNGTIIFV